MQFNLIELGGTLVVGAYLVLGVLLISHIFFQTEFLDKIQNFTQFEDIGFRALLVTIFFATGLLAEDLSNKFVDIDAPLVERGFLPSEKTLRYETLFGSNDPARINQLGEDMVRDGLITHYDPERGTRIAKALENRTKISNDDLHATATKLYYRSKNSVYKEANYYDELSKIQVRIDFSRSFAIISLFLLGLAFLFFVLKLGFIQAQLPAATQGGKHKRKETGQAVKRFLMLLLSFAFLYMVGHLAYGAEEREFNNRVYGYYYSNWLDARDPR